MVSLRLVTVALVVCVVGGCTDNADVSASPEKREHANGPVRHAGKKDTSVHVDHPEPSLPDAARTRSLDGAEAFVRYYIELLNYAANTGNVSRLRGSAVDCAGCREYEDLYKQTYERGGYMKEPGWVPTEVFAVRESPTSAGVLVTVRAPRMKFKLSKNAEEKIGAPDVYQLRFEVARRAGEWAVTEFGTQTEID